MLYYCLECRKNTESKNRKVAKAKNGRMMLSSECAVYATCADLLKSKNQWVFEDLGTAFDSFGKLFRNILADKPLLQFE